MKHNEDRDSLKYVPTFTLPAPPRFDAAAAAAAQPVEPLPKAKTLGWLHLSPKSIRINRRSKLLALMAVVGLATGAAGGMLVVQRDKQRFVDSSSMIKIPSEQPGTVEADSSPTQDNDANLVVAEPGENPIQVRRNQRRTRKGLTSETAVLSNADDEEELDGDKDDDDNKDKDEDVRKKNRGDRSRSAILYDVMRVRKP